VNHRQKVLKYWPQETLTKGTAQYYRPPCYSHCSVASLYKFFISFLPNKLHKEGGKWYKDRSRLTGVHGEAMTKNALHQKFIFFPSNSKHLLKNILSIDIYFNKAAYFALVLENLNSLRCAGTCDKTFNPIVIISPKDLQEYN
jgi:hypothetical protein